MIILFYFKNASQNRIKFFKFFNSLPKVTFFHVTINGEMLRFGLGPFGMSGCGNGQGGTGGEQAGDFTQRHERTPLSQNIAREPSATAPGGKVSIATICP